MLFSKDIHEAFGDLMSIFPKEDTYIRLRLSRHIITES